VHHACTVSIASVDSELATWIFCAYQKVVLSYETHSNLWLFKMVMTDGNCCADRGVMAVLL
jgi:hypothetical protein